MCSDISIGGACYTCQMYIDEECTHSTYLFFSKKERYISRQGQGIWPTFKKNDKKTKQKINRTKFEMETYAIFAHDSLEMYM